MFMHDIHVCVHVCDSGSCMISGIECQAATHLRINILVKQTHHVIGYQVGLLEFIILLEE